jgi:hypothetical protein
MKKIRNRFKSLLIKLFSYVSLHLRFRRFQKAILFEVMEKMSGRQEFQRFFEELYQKALRGMFIGMGGSVEESGELYVLKYIKRICYLPSPQKIRVGLLYLM